MAINFKSFSQLSAVLGLLLSSSLSFATDCYVESPGLEALGDDYYNFDLTHKLNREEKYQLKRFFNALDGDWKGSSTLMDCRGPDSKPRKVYKEYEVGGELISRSIDLNFKVKRRDPQQKVTKHDFIRLFDEKNLFSLEFSESNLIVFSKKYRRAVRTKKAQKDTQIKNVKDKRITGSRLLETIVEIKHQANSLELRFLHYSNGIFAAEEVFSLYR